MVEWTESRKDTCVHQVAGGVRVAWSGKPSELLSLVSLERESGLQVNLSDFGVALRMFVCLSMLRGRTQTACVSGSVIASP